MPDIGVVQYGIKKENNDIWLPGLVFISSSHNLLCLISVTMLLICNIFFSLICDQWFILLYLYWKSIWPIFSMNQMKKVNQHKLFYRFKKYILTLLSSSVQGSKTTGINHNKASLLKQLSSSQFYCWESNIQQTFWPLSSLLK